MSSNKDVTQSASATEQLIGCVKWFNNKAGYGFITVTDGNRTGTDVFVHHSAINVDSEQYKYLVQGEYVEFDLSTSSAGKHEFQASNVNGIKGGKLMCETRREFKLARTVYKTTSTTTTNKSDGELNTTSPPQPRQRQVPSIPRVRGEGPREQEKKEWTLVKGRTAEGSAGGRGPARPRGRPPRTTQPSATSNA